MNPKLLIGRGKNLFRVSSSKLRVIGNTHHRVDVYFLHLAKVCFMILLRTTQKSFFLSFHIYILLNMTRHVNSSTDVSENIILR